MKERKPGQHLEVSAMGMPAASGTRDDEPLPTATPRTVSGNETGFI